MATKQAHRRGSRPPRLGERAETLRRRAHRHARRGRCRKAAVALREVASLDGQARSWVALGDMLTRAGRTAEAVHAFRQGLWLHGQSGAEARARVVAELVLRIEPGDRLAARYARSEPWAA